jgi:hypothetical protein
MDTRSFLMDHLSTGHQTLVTLVQEVILARKARLDHKASVTLDRLGLLPQWDTLVHRELLALLAQPDQQALVIQVHRERQVPLGQQDQQDPLERQEQTALTAQLDTQALREQ